MRKILTSTRQENSDEVLQQTFERYKPRHMRLCKNLEESGCFRKLLRRHRGVVPIPCQDDLDGRGDGSGIAGIHRATNVSPARVLASSPRQSLDEQQVIS